MKLLSFQRALPFIFRPFLRTKYSTCPLSTSFPRSMSSNVSNLDLSGVYPPIATPFDDNENINFEKLKENIEKWNTSPLKGLVVQGSNGEFASLSEDERVSLIAFTKKHIKDGRLLIAGSGCESTKETIKMTKRMADAGADAALVVTPSFYKGGMTHDALCNHYSKVADASPIPIILYSVPANTTIDLPADIVIKLASHPNIIGLKDSGGDITKIAYMVYKTKQHNFQILAGSAGFFLPALHVGCIGGVFALAIVLPDFLCQVLDLYRKGKYDEALQLQCRLIAPNLAVTKKFGIAGVKTAMEWFGYHGGQPRSPLRPISPSQIELLRKDFKDSGFL